MAIETLVICIEEDTPDESHLVVLRAERLTQTERPARREKCIGDTISEWVKSNPTKAITKAYSDCVVEIKQRLKTHLEHIFKSDAKPIALLFEHKVEGKSLYDLRHVIAHGTVDALSEV